MSKYRINVRFDLDKQKEAKAAQYLQSLDKSRNDKHDYAELQSVLFEILLHISLTPICFSIPSSLQSGRPMTL